MKFTYISACLFAAASATEWGQQYEHPSHRPSSRSYRPERPTPSSRDHHKPAGYNPWNKSSSSSSRHQSYRPSSLEHLAPSKPDSYDPNPWPAVHTPTKPSIDNHFSHQQVQQPSHYEQQQSAHQALEHVAQQAEPTITYGKGYVPADQNPWSSTHAPVNVTPTHQHAASNPWSTSTAPVHSHSSTYQQPEVNPWTNKPAYSSTSGHHGHTQQDFSPYQNYQLHKKVEDLTTDVALLKSQSIIEDYFNVNDSQIDLSAGVINHLYKFCVDANTYVDIEVQMTMEDFTDNTLLTLMTPSDVNGNVNIFAQSGSNDATSPSSQSLIYRGLIAQEQELQICVTTTTAATIAPKRLQFGYKLYGSGHPFITTLDTSCIA